MTPEAARYLAKSREFLAKANGMLESWPDEAARAAYLAAFHAAQAFVFEQTGQVAKTHSGVRTRFGQLIRSDPGFDPELRAFLGRAYNFKAIADYDAGPGAEIPPEHAARAIRTALRFVDRIADTMATRA
jgi:uncharacterized protein (UPF0332 family)